jgi:uncharacterized protein (DUF2126 family)/transglutaminase-like putative cysteine protease
VSTRVAITHRIEQRFDRPTQCSTHWLRLRPAPHTRARISAYSLSVETEPHFVNWLRDPFENHLARLDLPEPITSLEIVLEIVAELEAINPFDFLTEPYAAESPFAYPDQLHKELEPYLRVAEPGPRLRHWIAELHSLGLEKTSTLERLTELNLRVHEAHALASGGIPFTLDPERILERGEGTCWELAWLLTLSLRHLDLAARFACGYRVVLDETASTRDSVGLHAWSEVFLPGAGWVGLDPATALFTNEKYLPLACTPDPMRARPLVDSDRNHPTTHSESLTVRRLVPVPETWPYTQTQWSDIEALGRSVEGDLVELGLEPTVGVSLNLVSSRDAAAPEWTFAALGASKRHAAESLLERLRHRLAPGGVTQIGQGQWYSGEELPRWRLGCFLRADGVPIWRDPARLGDGQRRFALSDARSLARALAEGLGIGKDDLLAAYEDPLHARRRAGAFPTPPDDGDLRDPARRRALAERLSEATGEAVGYVLPLRWDRAAGRFVSGPWRFRRGRLHLMPGEFPLGHRLPLGSLADDPESEREAAMERSPFEALGPLPGYATDALPPGEVGATPAARRPPRTALCVEPRAGRLHVFMPPLSHLEHYLQLIAAVEGAARRNDVAVVIEGYDPPEDPRLLRFALEPEAGVLRLTLPQIGAWDRRVEVLRASYTEARYCNLKPERITDDGQRLPAGGGSRMTLGGARPADSPFLVRPRILRGLIAYFQRHPCLSYLFAGPSIGEGGDAPRPDEGRDEALYELSIALGHLSREQETRPWHADRVLRHLLADPKGDLTRAEIRTDQLYAPDRAGLRLGRVVIGAFQTAPEERTAALQTLLLLGLLGRFARVGDDATLVRWGGSLHDRFMLPHALWQDLVTVVADLNDAGYPFQLDWFGPILALRFPLLGRVRMGAIVLELQTAHEPWPLLAEEVSGGGVARFLDVANERMQVRLTGLTPGRYQLVCNDRLVPLQTTGAHGEYVAGVRYKVWNPPATMHPTQPAVEALVFDLLDLWTGRVVGGCTYYPRPPAIWGRGRRSPRRRYPRHPSPRRTVAAAASYHTAAVRTRSQHRCRSRTRTGRICWT